MIARLAAAAAALALTTWLLVSSGLVNPTTAALVYLLIVLVTAATSPLWIALAVSAAATVTFNVFFLPPVGELRIADPQNWIAFFAFVRVLVNAVRKKIEPDPANPRYILTEPWVGYRFADDA